MRKKLPIFQILVMVVFAGLILTLNRTGKVIATHEYIISKYYRFEPLGEGEIEQYFVPKYEKLESIELFIANIYPETQGKICLTIYDGKGKKIFHKKYKASSIPTGQFCEYKINKRVDTEDLYSICLSYEGNSEEKPQLMITERSRNLIETETMYVEGTASEFNVAVTYHYSGRAH